ncbi:MAG TPA: AMP-binding protein [Desulfuromonadaceae bacterium]
MEQTAESPLPDDITARLLRVVVEVANELHPHGTARATLDSPLDRELGFDSLGRVELLARIERTFGCALAEQTAAAVETPRDLLRAVLASRPVTSGGEEVETAPMAAAQASVPDRARTLPEVLQWHADHEPDRCHIRFYADEGEGAVLTYGALAAGAARMAAGLQGCGLQPGEAVAIMLPTCPDYFSAFFGALLAGGIPVPMYPPARPTQIEDHLRRQSGILVNCMAPILVTSAEIAPVAGMLEAQVPTLRRVVTTAELSGSAAPALPLIAPDAVALLQYTSGSTGNPKGVVLTHRNLLANIRAMGAAGGVGPADVFVSWLPLYHDMGLIGAWLGSLYHAMPLVLMPPLAFLARPQRWLRAIHRHRGTLTAAPNFAFELCLRRIDETAGLDLGSLRAVCNGAEPISADTMLRFLDRFAAAGLQAGAMMPVYGLAECSVGLAFPPLGRGPVVDRVRRESLLTDGLALPAAPDEPALAFVACGQPLAGHQIRVVDDGDRELPERHEGRIQFRGPSATSGYYRNPDATRSLFHGEWLDSGDLGYLANGEIHITGRIKDIVIRAGRNIHPTELEEAVGDLAGIRKGNVAVFGSLDRTAGTERLVVVAETRETEPARREALTAAIIALASDLMGLPPDDVLLAPPNTVLKTSSGKIRRAACRKLYEDGAIGRSRRPAWRQIAALHLSAVVPRLRRLAAALAADLFAGRAWLVTALLVPAVWLGVMILPRQRWRWVLLRRAVRLLARVTGTPLAAEGLERLPRREEPRIYAANHASYLDALALIALVPREFTFVAKSELAGHWFIRVPLERIGTLFVERFETGRSIDDARTLVNAAAAGRSLMFFPEGTFTRIAGLMPFHMGAFVAAVEAGVPVVPLAIRGTRGVLRADSWFPRRGSITVVVGEAIPPPAGDRWLAAGVVRDAARRHILHHCGEPDLAAASLSPLGSYPVRRS